MYSGTRQTLLYKIRNQHDENAWGEFVNIYKPFIASLIIKMNVKDVDDLLQDTLIKCWKTLPDFEYKPDQGQFKSWLARMVYFNVISKNKVKKRRQELIEDYVQKDEVPPDVEELADVEWRDFISKKAWDKVSKDLSGGMKNVYELVLQNKDIPDIAKELEMKENTVYRYRQRVEEKLIKEMRWLLRELGSFQ